MMSDNIEELKENAPGKPIGETYNFGDQELIRQLVKSRMAQGKEVEYEDLSGYELPPAIHFVMPTKPAVSIKYGKMTFNMACLRLFADTMFILTPVNRTKKRLMVVPCKEEDGSALQWARVKESDGERVNRTISSEEFILKIYKMMGWNINCRYKILGRIAIAQPGPMPVLIFDLKEAIMFDSKPLEFVDEETGEIKKKQIKYYPEEYRDRIGKSYTDYVETRQMNLFEFLDDYTGKTYSDLPDKNTGKASTESVTSETDDAAAKTESAGANG